MDQALVQRRDAAGKRHEQALRRDPTRKDRAFRAELLHVVNELKAVVAAAGSSGEGTDAIEQAKTLRWLGDAQVDLGLHDAQNGGDAREQAAKGLLAYDAAAAALAKAQAPLDRAMIDFRYADALALLAGGKDPEKLEEAASRYESALRVFRAQGRADLAAAVEQKRSALRAQLVPAGRLDLFLSHAWEDKALLVFQRIEARLREQHEVRVDVANIRHGESIEAKLAEAIGRCTAVIVLWSEAASRSAAVQQEVKTAIALGKPVVPCRISAFGLQHSPELRGFEHLDFFERDVDAGLGRLSQLLLDVRGRDPRSASRSGSIARASRPPRS